MLTNVLIAVWLLTFVLGQLLLKPALDAERTAARSHRGLLFALAIASMTISFFLGVGLLQKLELSYLFPFQGLSVLLITAFATMVLKEKLTLPLALGALLIAAGVMLVSAS
ncbi:MAG: EamA family transporter [Verrucomicrobia bacterium]|nr:EamA family transporter [Verrucomicrobiota bacterium]